MIAGLDFTSRPSTRKQLWLAMGEVNQRRLIVTNVAAIVSFDDLAQRLLECDFDTMGCDFPFSLPSQFLEAANLPTDWCAFRGWCSLNRPDELYKRIDSFRAQQPSGQKLLFRPCDRLAQAISPMMLVGIPVAKMLYEGLIQTQRWNVTLAPCEPHWQNQSSRVAIEVYPALIARALQLGRYKTDRGGNIAVAGAQRDSALQQITSGALTVRYGFTIEIPERFQELAMQDGAGDALDAIFALIQTAWASRQPNLSIPNGISTNEGWIVDPLTANFRAATLVEP